MERRELSRAVLEHAAALTIESGAQALLVAAGERDVEGTVELLATVPEGPRVFVAHSGDAGTPPPPDGRVTRLRLPHLHLPRLSVVKVALLLAVSKGVVKPGETVVCVAGPSGRGPYDSVLVLQLGKEHELLGGARGELELPPFMRPGVFERVLELATRLAVEGREGRPVGTIFILAEPTEIEPYVKQLIFNPFRGYPEQERNILDPRLEETVREFAALDGAFVIRGDGVVESAGTFLRAGPPTETELEHGLGTRHAAAAGVTAASSAIAIVLSQSTGTVRVYAKGQLLAAIERAPGQPGASEG